MPVRFALLALSTVQESARWLFLCTGWGLGGADIETSKSVLPQKANCRDSIEGNWHPHTAQLCKLQSDMNVLEPKGGALGGYAFNSANTESARIYPDLPSQKGLILPLRDDQQNLLRNDAEVLSPKKNEIVVHPTDLAIGSFLRRLGFPV